jgi:hypothetical protein
LYGNGTPAYKAAITTPCGTSGKGCAQGQPIGPGETLECEVETGNMGGNTHDALTERDENFGIVDSSSCDAATLAEAVEKAESECGLSRVVPIPIIDAWPSHGHDSVQIFGLATFYIAGWDRTPPYKGQDMDGDTLDDMVWGYFLQDQPITEAWNIQWGYSDDPFAPTRVLLVE